MKPANNLLFLVFLFQGVDKTTSTAAASFYNPCIRIIPARHGNKIGFTYGAAATGVCGDENDCIDTAVFKCYCWIGGRAVGGCSTAETPVPLSWIIGGCVCKCNGFTCIY
jgi:hypothetical protein